MKNIGFIGVGYMGYGIAKNILDKADEFTRRPSLCCGVVVLIAV